MAMLKFFHPKTRVEVSDQSARILNEPEYTEGLHGSVVGSIDLEVNSSNRAFLRSLKENSHFVKFNAELGGDHTVGLVVEDAYINQNVCTVEFCGFYEYIAKMILVASEKWPAMVPNRVIRQDDMSYIKTFHSDCSEGVLYEVLKNLEDFIQASGHSIFWDYGNLKSKIINNTTQVWRNSYRLNSQELTTVQQSLSDILSDKDMDLLRVTVDKTGPFIWHLNFSSTNIVKAINEAADPIVEIELDTSNSVHRAYSMASGTSLSDQGLLSFMPMDTEVAFSMHTVENPAEKIKSLVGVNASAIQELNRSIGQVSFSSYDYSIAPLYSKVTIDSPAMPEPITCVITEISLNGSWYRFTGTVISGGDKVKGRRPASNLTRGVIDPLAKADRRARDNAFRRESPSGWRSLGD